MHAPGRLTLLLSWTCLMGTGCTGSGPSDGYEQGEEYPGGETTNTLLFGEGAFSRHVENITEENEIAFFSGNGFFNQPWVTAPSSTKARDGLGPLFNARACSDCHFKDGRGRPPLSKDEQLLSMLFRIRVDLDEDELPIGDEIYGAQLQPYAVADVPPEGSVEIEWRNAPGEYEDGSRYELTRPEYTLVDLSYGPLGANAVLSPRVAPAMHGLGLLEAIDASRLVELADEEDEDGDGISGRMRMLPDASGKRVVGRFGWKAEQPSIRAQSAGAFLGDMGLSSAPSGGTVCTKAQEKCRTEPDGVSPEDGEEFEVSNDILDRIERYGQLLAVPQRHDVRSEEVLAGKRLFTDVGCADCHVPRHETGQAELDELSHQTIYPYTDLLLHDMGEELADGDGTARVDREWRTPPLWGLRYYETVNDHDRLLHDGRARGVEEAILWHGGEGKTSRNAFKRLSKKQRERLIRFVESL